MAMSANETALAGLVARLEAAVLRLERLDPRIIQNFSPPTPPRSVPASSVPVHTPAPAPVPSTSSSGGDAPSVAAFRELLESTDFGVARVLAAADKIGGQVLVATKLLQDAFTAEYGIVKAISHCKVGWKVMGAPVVEKEADQRDLACSRGRAVTVLISPHQLTEPVLPQC